MAPAPGSVASSFKSVELAPPRLVGSYMPGSALFSANRFSHKSPIEHPPNKVKKLSGTENTALEGYIAAGNEIYSTGRLIAAAKEKNQNLVSNPIILPVL